MNTPFVIVNDDLVAASQAAVLVSDLAIQRGYGIFDFFKTAGHAPVFIDDHLDRFFHSAAQLRLPLGMNRDGLLERINMLLQRNDMPDAGIKLTLTGGYSEDGYTLSKPNLVITQRPLPLTDPAVYNTGIRLVSYSHQRQMPEIKTIDYLMAIWLQPYIREMQADDVLYHRDGVISECPRSNFFLVTDDDTIVTPGENVLKGIIRMKLLELAGTQFRIEERPLTLAELQGAKEAFITSTTKHILPVVRVDGRIIGEGKPGPVAGWLNKGIERLIAGQDK